MNLVYQADDGLWYFWDEAVVYSFGPFETEEVAKEAFIEYGKRLTNG